MKRLKSGFLLKDILDRFKNKAESKIPNERMAIFSGHDMTIASLLNAMGLYWVIFFLFCEMQANYTLKLNRCFFSSMFLHIPHACYLKCTNPKTVETMWTIIMFNCTIEIQRLKNCRRWKFQDVEQNAQSQNCMIYTMQFCQPATMNANLMMNQILLRLILIDNFGSTTILLEKYKLIGNESHFTDTKIKKSYLHRSIGARITRMRCHPSCDVC